MRSTVEAAARIGLDYLTLFAFSSENWNRPVAEVEDLMGLFRLYLKKEIRALHREGIRLRVIGRRERLPEDIVDLIAEGEATTAANRGMNFILAISYGARDELLRASRALASDIAAGRLQPDEVSEAAFRKYLQTADIPDPDMIIRTSGEQRLSNFLLWQAAYAELIFLNVLWPDFKPADLQQAVSEYQRRERRYGAAVGS